MKHGGFRALCLVLLTCGALFSMYAQEKAINLESRILESFDGQSGFSWRVSASRFATKGDTESFPKIATVASGPAAIHGYNREGRDVRSLGVWGRFDRKGYNWIDVYPVEEGAGADARPAEIPLPGRVRSMDVWVWGANFNYYLEVYIRDFRGVVHVINMGDLSFQGWKNLKVNIPANIPQARRTLPLRQGLTLVKFRVWTRPVERVDDFQVYFNQIKVLTDTFEALFDGDELADPARVQSLWGAGSNAN